MFITVQSYSNGQPGGFMIIPKAGISTVTVDDQDRTHITFHPDTVYVSLANGGVAPCKSLKIVETLSEFSDRLGSSMPTQDLDSIRP